MLVPGGLLPHARPAESGWTRHFSPRGFLPQARKPVPWLACGAVVACALGFYIGFFVAPLDARQGDVHRMVYIHVPATWMAVAIFMLMALWVGVGLFGRARLAPMMVEALAPTGAMFAFMALWTGSLWGKPVWGVWWVWDMRLVADLVLLGLYLAIVALHACFEDSRLADRISAQLVLLGMVIVPAMLASVALWPTIGQGPTLRLPGSAGNPPAMFIGLIAIAAGFCLYGSATALLRLRCVILERERQSDWLAQRERGPGRKATP